jgi:hypothetical protein
MEVEDKMDEDKNNFDDEMMPSTTEENIYCDLFPEEMVRNKGGIIFQFFNIFKPSDPNSIGANRIKLQDIGKVPKYLSKYGHLVKQLAFDHLACGTSKRLYKEDYAISFSVASLSAAGVNFSNISLEPFSNKRALQCFF